MSGPYETEAQAAADIAHVAGSGNVRHIDRRAKILALNDHLLTALESSKVRLGDYDLQVGVWLCGWEPSVVQVVADWVRRAHEAGRAAR